MRQPSAGTRWAARPRVSAALFILSGFTVILWLRGDASWWMALIAAIAAERTREARREVRRYQTWLAAWQDMGGEEEAAPPAPSLPAPRRIGRALVTMAIVYVLGVPMALPRGATPSMSIVWLWGAACLFLICKLLMWLARSFRRSVSVVTQQPAKTAKGKAAEDATVAWLLPPASSSPSRMDAMRQLPQYCAPILARALPASARQVETGRR